MFRFKYAGHAVIIPPLAIEFRVSSQAKNNWKFEKEKSRNIIITVDDETVFTGIMERVKTEKSHTVNITFMQYYEVLSVLIPTPELLKSAEGRKVIIQIGKDNKFKLSKEELKLLQKFLTLAK